MSSSSPTPQNPGLKRKRFKGGSTGENVSDFLEKAYYEYVSDTEAETSLDEELPGKPKTKKKRNATLSQARDIVGGCSTTDIPPDNVGDVLDIEQIRERLNRSEAKAEELEGQLRILRYTSSQDRKKLEQYEEAQMYKDVLADARGQVKEELNERLQRIEESLQRIENRFQ